MRLLYWGQSDFEAITTRGTDQPGNRTGPGLQCCKPHVTHEQFHSEISSDLNLEHLPLGKFSVNDLMPGLARLACSCWA